MGVGSVVLDVNGTSNVEVVVLSLSLSNLSEFRYPAAGSVLGVDCVKTGTLGDDVDGTRSDIGVVTGIIRRTAYDIGSVVSNLLVDGTTSCGGPFDAGTLTGAETTGASLD